MVYSARWGLVKSDILAHMNSVTYYIYICMYVRISNTLCPRMQHYVYVFTMAFIGNISAPIERETREKEGGEWSHKLNASP